MRPEGWCFNEHLVLVSNQGDTATDSSIPPFLSNFLVRVFHCPADSRVSLLLTVSSILVAVERTISADMIIELANSLHNAISYVAAKAFHSITFRIFSFLGALYMLWRSWAFTLLPMLRPHEPPELPYWIPGECS